jgi:NAD(P) transhydrogenase subunit alpha
MPKLPPIHVGLLRETFPGERRVALTPFDVARLSGRMAISFEAGCGVLAGHDDNAYIAAGAQPASLETIAATCNVIVAVRRPAEEISFPNASALVFLGSNEDWSASGRTQGNALELDLARLEGFAEAGCMDVSTTQSTISGHAAVLEGARQLGIGHPMLVLNGSFVRPVRIAALGSDAAGLQAIATARRLGALTCGFGFDDHDRQKIETLGAKFIAVDPILLQTATIPPRSEHIEARRQLAAHLSEMQLIITSVSDISRPAPILIDEETTVALSSGTVVIDLAISRGGNCSMTRADELVTNHAVRIIGSTTLASDEAGQASRLFGEGISTILEQLTSEDGRMSLDRQNLILDRLIGWNHDRSSMAS